MQAVSALDPTAQPQPFTGHPKEDLQFLGTFSVSNLMNVLEHTGMPDIRLTSLQVVHLRIRSLSYSGPESQNKHRKKHQPQCSLPESAGGYRCSLFLGRLDQGRVGNAESTHVNRPKGKALLASWVGRCCKLSKGEQ